ncbi:MAG: hypothetical protein JW794_01875 [Candidatus Cloacimonetes bacterium]|nr:hypothetical protein [Candidatus Cloacimonadota bacterium]
MSEKKKIIDMLAAGTINASQAEELIKAISSKKKRPTQNESKRMVFDVIKRDTEKRIIHISIPVAFINAGLKIIPKEATIKTKIGESSFDISSINWEDIFSQAVGGEIGDLFYMEIEDENNPLIIHIYIE